MFRHGFRDHDDTDDNDNVSNPPNHTTKEKHSNDIEYDATTNFLSLFNFDTSARIHESDKQITTLSAREPHLDQEPDTGGFTTNNKNNLSSKSCLVDRGICDAEKLEIFTMEAHVKSLRASHQVLLSKVARHKDAIYAAQGRLIQAQVNYKVLCTQIRQNEADMQEAVCALTAEKAKNATKPDDETDPSTKQSKRSLFSPLSRKECLSDSFDLSLNMNEK